MNESVDRQSPAGGMGSSIARITCALSLVAAACLIASGAWAAHHWPHRQDRHLFEYMGQRIAAGGTIYQDAWDNKPPLLPWINAGILAASDDSTVAVTVVAGIAAGITVASLAVGTASVFGPAVACLVSLLAAGVLSLRYYDGCTNGTELYAAMFDSIAATCLLLSLARRGLGGALLILLAGLAFAAAFATKQNAVAGPAAAGVVMLIGLAGKHQTSMLVRLSGLVAGFAAGLSLLVLILRRQGALDDAVYAVFTVNRLFVSSGLSWWMPSRGAVDFMVEQAAPLALLIWLASLTLVGTLASVLSKRPPEHDGGGAPLSDRWMVGIMILWLLLAAYSTIWGGCHLTRYWHVCFVPLFWLSAQALHLIGRTVSRATPAGRAIVVAVALTAAWLLARPTVHRQWSDLRMAYYYATEDSERVRLREIARAVEQRTGPDDRIYVWGYEPGIYRFSRRAAPCRFCELCKVEMIGPPAQFMVDEVVAALTRRPPRLLVIRRDHRKAIGENQWARVDTADFLALLTSSYRPVQEVGDCILYERLPASTSPATGSAPK